MNRAFKLFAACVTSLRTAEKEYEMNPTRFNKNIVASMQNKVDGWLAWIDGKEDVETTSDVPPFIGNPQQRRGYQGVSADITKQLIENHSPEEIERYTRLMENGWKE